MPNAFIVEDEILIARSAQIMLESSGYHVVGTAADVEEAVTLSMSLKPDVVLMDIKLRGGGDGTVAARRINEKLDVPVVFATAYGDEDTLTRARAASPYGYVLKPYDKANLRAAIEVALDRHRLEREIREREQWLAATMNSLHEGIVTLQPDGAVRGLNPAAQRQLGPGPYEGRSIGMILQILDGGDDRLPYAIENGETLHGEYEIHMLDDGRKFFAELQFQRIVDDHGRTLGAILAFNDITSRRQLSAEREQMIGELQAALDNVKTLNGLLPICSHCKKIRNDKGYWTQVEEYITRNTDAVFTHGLCPDCAQKLYPEYYVDEPLV
jgi:PAS domain S-box-containing protein